MKKISLFLLCAFCAIVANAAGSGLFLRGGLNSWAADADWEFQTTDVTGVYTLENKTVFGSFKVADANWQTYNYGALSIDAPALGTPYVLAPGSQTNIDLGSKTYVCTKITLTISGDNATILFEGSEQAETETTEVYVIGNNNNWNFTDDSGKLSATGNENEFAGDVTFPDSGDGLAYWRIYEKLGGVGCWGFTENTTENTLEGTFSKGVEGCCTTTPGDYTVTFNLATGAFKLVAKGGSVDTIEASATIAANAGEIVVNGANSVAVYTVGGALISTDARTKVARGLYIVRADNQVKKVIVK